MPQLATFDRRPVLGGLLLASAAALTGVSATRSRAVADIAPTVPPLLPRIDVHAHYLPDFYREAAIAAGHRHPDGMPGLPHWDSRQAVEMMDRLNIRSAMLSVSSPGVHFGNAAAARVLARRVNDEGARAVADHPGRFGLLASLTLPDLDGALTEAAYAFDVLKADGVVLQSNHRGIYMGDSRFHPLFEELDRRRAVVFMHPTSSNCACCPTGKLAYPRPMLEFMFETTRAVANLILTGTLDRFANIKLIVPHAGAAVPILADRIVGLAPALQLPHPVDPDRVFAALRNLYYDLAGFPLPRLLPALQQIADPARLLYGSDWPFTPLPIVARLAQEQDATPLLDDAGRRRVLHDNALSLFPRLML